MNSYESHITIDPVGVIDELDKSVTAYGFRLAKLYMDKGIPNQKDTFMTGHSVDIDDITSRTIGLVKALQRKGFVIRRYKIEQIIIDSRSQDVWRLL